MKYYSSNDQLYLSDKLQNTFSWEDVYITRDKKDTLFEQLFYRKAQATIDEKK